MKLFTHIALAVCCFPSLAAAEVTSRTDFSHFIYHNVRLDTWQPAKYCDPGTYVTGFRLAIEKTSSAKVLDSVRDIAVICSTLDGKNHNEVVGDLGLPMSHGSWSETAWCPFSEEKRSQAVGYAFINGAKFHNEWTTSYLALGCNDFDLTLVATANELESHSNNENAFKNACKINQAICGIQLGLFEIFPGAVAGVSFPCCSTKAQ